MSKVESFYWNKLSSKSFSFESEQFFYLCFVLAIQGGCTDNIQYIKSVQSALSDLKRPPERLQSQCNYRPFIT